MSKKEKIRYCGDIRIVQSYEKTLLKLDDRNLQHVYCDKSHDKYRHEFSSKVLKSKYDLIVKKNKPRFSENLIDTNLYLVSLLYCYEQVERMDIV